jgi:hypothetical protein
MPLKNGKGKAVYTRIRRLLLDDGTETFGCIGCDITADSPAKLFHHVGSHDNGGPPPAAPKRQREKSLSPESWRGLTVEQLLNAGQQVQAMGEALEKVSADRNEWRSRALKAERELGTIRRLLGGAS